MNISYELIFDLLRSEKSKQELQEIDKTFFKQAYAWLSELKNEIAEQLKQSMLSYNYDVEKKKIELKNINKLLSELRDRRLKKIVLLALTRARIPSAIINISAFTTEEEELFNNLVITLRDYRKHVEQSEPDEKKVSKEKKALEEQKMPEEQKTEQTSNDFINVMFLNKINKFYGPNKKIYGPFEANDTAELPSILANILIKKGVAKKI